MRFRRRAGIYQRQRPPVKFFHKTPTVYETKLLQTWLITAKHRALSQFTAYSHTPSHYVERRSESFLDSHAVKCSDTASNVCTDVVGLL